MDLGLSTLLSGAIGGVTSPLTTWMTNRANERAVRQTNKAQMDLAKYQADRNLDLWNLNNEYNTPQAQMERYKAAGLNPNLVYGDGGVSGNSSAPAQGYTAPTLRAPRYDYSGITTGAQMLMNGLSQASAIRKQNSETAMNYQQLSNLEQDNSIKKIMYLRQQIGLAMDKTTKEFLGERLRAEISNLDARTMQSTSQSFLTDQNRLLLEAQRPFLQEQAREELNGLKLKNRGLEIENTFKSDMFVSQLSLAWANYQLAVSRNEQIRIANEIRRILLDQGLDIDQDAFDRMFYTQSMGLDTGGRAINEAGKTIGQVLKAIIR